MADTAAEKQEALLQRMAQTIGDTAAKYWIGVAGVITAAGILRSVGASTTKLANS